MPNYRLACFLLSVFLTVSPSRAEMTNCTAIASVPFTISAPGVYCLKSNLINTTDPAPAYLAGAIEIQADDVTLDLNGFRLSNSLAGPANRMNGIVAFYRKNVIVRNGQIDGFRTAVLLGGIIAQRSVVEHIRADGSNERGMFVVGDNSLIRNNHITNVGPGDVGTEATGITLVYGLNSVVEGNVVASVSETASAHGIGVVFSASVTVRDNTVFDIKNATQKYGISLYSVTRAAVIGNQVINGDSGNAGIANLGFSSQVGCFGNVISGFVSANGGCDLSVGDTAF